MLLYGCQMAGRRRWTILAVGTFAQAATCSFLYGMPMLVPALREREGLTLFQASLLVSAPIVGLLLTLIAWGALADRHGERLVIVSGVGAAALLLAVVPFISGIGPLAIVLGAAGAAAASVNAASGRVVMGWFPVHERGLAMGTRQTAQPLGVALAALVLPTLARSHGARDALLFPAALCALAALLVLLLVADPPRPPRVAGAGRPRRHTGGHGNSAGYTWPARCWSCRNSRSPRSRWPTWSASGTGIRRSPGGGSSASRRPVRWTDRGRRVVGPGAQPAGPMRQLAVLSAALMLLIALGALVHQGWIIVGFALGAIVTVADNGLAYTSVAELAGSAWAGRALGIQNTVQNVAAVATAPVLAAVIGDSRYALAFLVAAICPVLAVPLTPVRAERMPVSARG